MSVYITPSGNQDLFLNLSNRNFKLVFEALGWQFTDEDYCGGCSTDEMWAALRRFAPMALVRPTVTFDATKEHCAVVDCGIDLDRAIRYLETLVEITEVAERDGVDITWS